MFIIAIMLPIVIILSVWSYDKEQKRRQEFEKARRESYLLMLESSPLYQVNYSRAISMCVRSNYQACALARPVDETNHLAEPGQGVMMGKNGMPIFCYRFERSVVSPGGGKLEYSTLPAKQMTGILNRAFPNYCLRNGVWALYIEGQKDADSGFVNFYIAPFDSWELVRKYLFSVGYTI